jgi:hypothetical protein
VKPFVLYTAARVALFAVTAVVVWLLLGLPTLSSLNLLWVMLIAMVVSSVLSIRLLAGLRGDLSASVAARAEQVSERVERSRRREDGLD